MIPLVSAYWVHELSILWKGEKLQQILYGQDFNDKISGIQLILKFHYRHYSRHSQPAITRSKLTVKTLEQGVKYVQS